jgi:hypothetical protein
MNERRGRPSAASALDRAFLTVRDMPLSVLDRVDRDRKMSAPATEHERQ